MSQPVEQRLELVAPEPRTATAVSSAQRPATPAYLLQVAVERGADLAYVEKLMALQERWEANEARRAFTEDMTAFKAEPIDIFKRKSVGYTTKEGEFVGYKHAELSDVTDAVVPALAKHGFSHRWDVRQLNGLVEVTCVVTHRRGHSESLTMQAPPDASGKKNPIQQIASAVAYLQRYTLLGIVGLATKGEDNDGQGSGEGQDITELLNGLRELKDDGAARSYWISKRDALREDKPAYERFKAAVVAHRRALAGGKP